MSRNCLLPISLPFLNRFVPLLICLGNLSYLCKHSPYFLSMHLSATVQLLAPVAPLSRKFLAYLLLCRPFILLAWYSEATIAYNKLGY